MKSKKSKKPVKPGKDDSYLKRFWYYLWHDNSLGSYALNFILAFILIKYIFFPGLGFILGNDIPIVAVVSGSMEHRIVNQNICGNTVERESSWTLPLDTWWDYCGEYYETELGITYDQFEDFPFTNGLNKGDVVVLKYREISEIEIGDILVFVPGDLQWYSQNGPVIHRVVNIFQEDDEIFFQTKGDQNDRVFTHRNFENRISEDQIIAVALFRVPVLGYGRIFLDSVIGLFIR